MYEKVKPRLNLENVCHHSFLSVLHICVLLTLKTHRTIILLAVYVVAKLAFSLQGKNSLKMCGNKVLTINLGLKEESDRTEKTPHESLIICTLHQVLG
jgi:hypothetical protein